ncbi:hypothetical protein VTO73DRAFT_10198 [Trametes versicolor]
MHRNGVGERRGGASAEYGRPRSSQLEQLLRIVPEFALSTAASDAPSSRIAPPRGKRVKIYCGSQCTLVARDAPASSVRPSSESLHDVYERPAKLLGIKHLRMVQLRVVEHL